MTTMQVIHEVDLDDQFFEDIICTMFEGGSNYWIDHITINHPCGKKPTGIPTSMWAANALNENGTVIVFVSNFDDKCEEITLVKNMLIEGLDKWAMNYQDHVSIVIEGQKCTIDAGDIDANDADIILQYALFNEIVFG